MAPAMEGGTGLGGLSSEKLYQAPIVWEAQRRGLG